ncbi:putative extracellular serine carboxypeptidase [Fulvia fulva]|uniref:Extracellular serine carboxypeptidase n=1 Tax=Passalora fulva TaxID=5499 RepID=A0A9Q8L7W6_PASFU|nr:putative extracellular serine carboxypeptidase [Fulvia fulva]KAK4634856.1 putative extracellular serine carboxypeptidase [Fulvia fulva]KAK4637452.1 putative extracellular serine carboxypeptidase [Fulvia fulva]UJO12354.1 putative extracellular serine carboxypeptidase [Fulvia fulva]WPV10385.1 putative extracellular serine carboxypeptidase [Fulvia fulva]WPV24000.1 putative extracellular serine carboxypeptidase [Fulvia fulva]
MYASSVFFESWRISSSDLGFDYAEHKHPITTLAKRAGEDPLQILYPEHWIDVPVDHFQNETKYEPHDHTTFQLRYWFDAQHYQPGGPVFVLQSGETSGTDRLPFLQKGIVAQITKATNGLGVILEHRYYGTSFPVKNLTTENFRFLTTAQAMADMAYFAQNVEFPGVKGNLTSDKVPWIAYGGSYAGAFVAFLRKQYPDVYWGAISSSGVTEAIWDYWQYYQPIIEHAPQHCIATQRDLISVVDGILIGKNSTDLPMQLKAAFDVADLTYDVDFANYLGSAISWQSLNWDPAVSSDSFYRYCNNITSAEALYPGLESRRSNVTNLIDESGASTNKSLETAMLNMIGYFNTSFLASCDGTADSCFGRHNQTYYDLTTIEDANYKSWPYQYCTEWGFLQTGNTPPEYGAPIVSRLMTLEDQSLICRAAFNITTPPDISTVNKYGGYNISYPRLAIVDGDWDPWKPSTPHGFEFGAKERMSTASEPFILIAEAVHHWDENGLFPNETTATLPPHRIVDVQAQELQFVQEWLLAWEQACMVEGRWELL